MKIAKHSYELVQIAEGTGVSSYTMPVVRVIEPYVLTVKGAKAVYEINADARIAPSTISHRPITNDGAELDGNPDTYAQRTTNSNTTEDVKTYDFQVVKPLFVCVTYYTASRASLQIHASEDGTTWTLAFSGNSDSKTTGCFFVKARYLRWVNKIADTMERFTRLFELEAHDCSQTTIVSYPDEFNCIIHEARRTTSDGSKWYTLLIEPQEGLAYDYWLYKLRPAMGYYKVTLDKEVEGDITDLYNVSLRGTLTLRGTRTEVVGFDEAGYHWVRGVSGSDNDLFMGFRRRGAGDIVIYFGAPTLPRADNVLSLGSSSFRWANLYAVNVYTGDLNFQEKVCEVCGQPFLKDDELVLKVKEVDDYTRTVPVHLKCSQAYKELDERLKLLEEKVGGD